MTIADTKGICKQHTELNVLVCCLSRVRKRTIYDGLEDHGQVSCTPAELSSLCHFVALKIFVRLIFVVVGHQRNIFNDKNFLIYGTVHLQSIYMHEPCPYWKLSSITHQTQVMCSKYVME